MIADVAGGKKPPILIKMIKFYVVDQEESIVIMASSIFTYFFAIWK